MEKMFYVLMTEEVKLLMKVTAETSEEATEKVWNGWGEEIDEQRDVKEVIAWDIGEDA